MEDVGVPVECHFCGHVGMVPQRMLLGRRLRLRCTACGSARGFIRGVPMREAVRRSKLSRKRRFRRAAEMGLEGTGGIGDDAAASRKYYQYFR